MPGAVLPQNPKLADIPDMEIDGSGRYVIMYDTSVTFVNVVICSIVFVHLLSFNKVLNNLPKYTVFTCFFVFVDWIDMLISKYLCFCQRKTFVSILHKRYVIWILCKTARLLYL